MVRIYKRPVGARNYGNYSAQSLHEALEKIKRSELSEAMASKLYNIPRSTLQNRRRNLHSKKYGGQTILSEEEEKLVVAAVIKVANWGFPFTACDLRTMVKSYLSRIGRKVEGFADNSPGKEWTAGFFKRHRPELVMRLTTNLPPARAKLSPALINEYFDNLEETLKDVPPSNIINYDETNLVDEPGKKLVVVKRGSKHAYAICRCSKSATSIMFSGSADGVMLPPYIVYKSKNLFDSWRKGGPKGEPCCACDGCKLGSRYNRAKHGWFDTEIFCDWFENVMLPHARLLPGRKVLIGDNLSSHFNVKVLRLCEENDISFVCLPPNSTHICQPLDVAFFAPLKKAWRQVLLEYKPTRGRIGSAIDKGDFPRCLKSLLNKLDKGEEKRIGANIVSGFKACGIAPLDRNHVLKKLPEYKVSDSSCLNESLLEVVLQQYRFCESEQPKSSQKKRKLHVAPGKSVLATKRGEAECDLSDFSADENMTDQPSTSKPKNRKRSEQDSPKQCRLSGSYHYIEPLVSLAVLKYNDYVSTVCNGKWWLATVESLKLDEVVKIKVSFLHPPGPTTTFHRPPERDEGWYEFESILCRLKVLPKATGSASRTLKYSLPEEVVDELDALFAASLVDQLNFLSIN